MEINSRFSVTLNESDIENKLKDFFVKVINFAGEDYAYLTLTTEEGVKDSITKFSKHFDDCSDIDITLALIKGALLSNLESESINLVRELVRTRQINDLIYLSDTNLGFRRQLTANYMAQCELSNSELYRRSKNKQSVRSDLLTLGRFQEELQTKQDMLKKEKTS